HLEARHPKVTHRHKTLIKCLEDTGIIVELSRFKPKIIKCPNPLCRKEFTKYDEKETDVALAVKLLEIFYTDECDTAVLVTGDTDLAPAVRAAKRLFPKKCILFAFPYRRQNNELHKLAPGSFVISKRQYARYQFPNPYKLADGTLIEKPASW
ncbi:MAG TPA: NYN domain-containing protein, partial [Deltaproteobacteria bacterium]|nr:NYN domain-containing protein [Deltaproteobacteria bacterium]